MNQTTGTADWINCYLEWTDPEGLLGARGRIGCSGMEVAGAGTAEDESAAAYLEWLDAAPPAPERSFRLRARDGDADMGRANDFRVAMQEALRTESDCIRFLKQVLEAGNTTTRALGFVSEALLRAEKLIEDERGAVRAQL